MKNDSDPFAQLAPHAGDLNDTLKQFAPEVARSAGLPRAVLSVVAVVVVVVAALVWGLNTLRIDRPVSQALSSDSRNTGFSLRAHYRYYLDPSALVLDLREADSVSPLDLYRGTFQSAKALHEAGRRFDRVVFARSGAPVFWMTGEDFQSLGREYAAGENPLYLIRTLPGHLHRPDGEPLSHSQGGMASQFDEANEAMRRWIRGS